MKFLAQFILQLHRLLVGQPRTQNAEHRLQGPQTRLHEPHTSRPPESSVRSQNAANEFSDISSNATDRASEEFSRSNSQHISPSLHPKEQHRSTSQTSAAPDVPSDPEEHLEPQRIGTKTAPPIIEKAASTPRRTKSKNLNKVQSTFSRPTAPPSATPRQATELATTVHQLNEIISDHTRNHVTHQELKRELESLRRLMESKK